MPGSRYVGSLAPLFVLLVSFGLGCGPTTDSDESPSIAPPTGVPDGAPTEGKWRVARESADSTLVAGDSAARLGATPYLQGYRPARARTGVLVHDSDLAYPGLNLYVSGHAAEAHLVDNEGAFLHRWRYPLEGLWPEVYRDEPETAPRLEYWRRASLLPNGDLLAIYEGLGLVRLAPDSSVRWAYRGGAHHDLSVEGGVVRVLDRRVVSRADVNPELPILEDLVTELDLATGDVLARHSLVDALQAVGVALPSVAADGSGDILHTNTIERLGPAASGSSNPDFRPGSHLVSIRGLDRLALLDDQWRVVWTATGAWRMQHEPTLVDAGRILLFDNLGAVRGSRVIEIDPDTSAIEWTYPDPPSTETLYSKTLGSARRLPNGNTLITESENGRAIEVTRDGTIVWEFSSPHRAGARDELVATLFEVVRMPIEGTWRPESETSP